MQAINNGRQPNFLDKIGIPSHLAFGYLGIMIFMMGDGLELAWISPYLVDNGFSIQQAGILASTYGITIALAAWGSGVIAQTFGIKRTMLIGLILYLIGTVGFIGFGIQNLSMTVMLPTYALRGFGYPLFAYSFLLWITLRTPQKQLGSAGGWFWFAFTGGLNVLGAYYSIIAIKYLGHINTLWSSIFWVLIGALLALVVNRDKIEKEEKLSTENKGDKVKELLKAITILKREPKVLIAGVVRMTCTIPQFAYPVFLPIFLNHHYGLSTEMWLSIWGIGFMFNMAFNIIFGIVGDKWGWRRTIKWAGGVGGGISTIFLIFAPGLSGGSPVVIGIAIALWTTAMAGYVPITALTPSLVKEDKGAAISILNLGGGLPVFIGPALVTIFLEPLGETGLLILFAGLYFVSAFLTKFLVTPEESEKENRQGESEAI